MHSSHPIYRALVTFSNSITGEIRVKIPALLGADSEVTISYIGRKAPWAVPAIGEQIVVISDDENLTNVFWVQIDKQIPSIFDIGDVFEDAIAFDDQVLTYVNEYGGWINKSLPTTIAHADSADYATSAGNAASADYAQSAENAQSIMSFANASARDTYFAYALTEGLITYLKDVDKMQFYDGSSWRTIGTTSGSATNTGLTKVYSTTATNVAYVGIDNVFTSQFRNYKIHITSLGGNTLGGRTIAMRMRSGGTVTPLSGTSYSFLRNNYYSSPSQSYSATSGVGYWYMQLYTVDTSGSVSRSSADIELKNPAVSGIPTNIYYTNDVAFVGTGLTQVSNSYGSNYDSTAFDGIHFYSSINGSVENGLMSAVITIYGYN